MCVVLTVEAGSEEPDWNNEDEVIQRLVLIAIVGIEDPVRPEVCNFIRQITVDSFTVMVL